METKTSDLIKKKCVPCEGNVPPLKEEKITELAKEISTEWHIIENKKIFREFSFVNFRQAIDFVNKIAELAENEGHHPDIHISYNKVGLELMTHAINGLSENDFILAAKIERIQV
jgi:4a-hydroxytetrahydrobiopterin dehydratase